MPNNLLLTGRPGVGKTTIVRKVIVQLDGQAGGFYTEEVRERGKRVGFRIVTLDGETAWLARVNMPSSFRVGRYGVDVQGLERVGVPAIRRALASRRVVIIDEIGKMELFSPAFMQVTMEVLDAWKPLVGTVMLKSHPWVNAVKRRADVVVWEVTESNRDEMPNRVLDWLAERLPKEAQS